MARRERMAGRRNRWYSGTKAAANKRFSRTERSVNLVVRRLKKMGS